MSMRRASSKGWIENSAVRRGDLCAFLLYRHASAMLQDGILDAEEAADLMHLLHSFAGLVIGRQEQAAQFFTAPSDLPVVNFPAPDLVFQDRVFVFTGTMAFRCARGMRGALIAWARRRDRWGALARKSIISA
ncbi:hypothetical protein P4126_33740 [Pseudomonas aeruginosa]|nr:hypothetical protein [Pseudomonas aeruginosa]